MPTIIDELIVQLSLDPKGFDETQKKSAETLRQMERNARAAQVPLNNLGQQARRTGSSVAAGASVGENALKNLAIAGGEAFAALKTVEGVIGSIASATERGAALSRASWMIGLPGGTRQLDALIQAAEEAAHVPQGTSINLLNDYQQRLEENKRTGKWSQEFTEASRLGINIQAPILDQIKQIRAALQGRSGPETQAWVNSVGLGPWLSFLKLSQEQADAAQNRAGQHALDPAQAKELERAQTAAVRFENSMVHLWEVLTAHFSKNGFTAALEGWSLFIDKLVAGENVLNKFAEAIGKSAIQAGIFGPGVALLYNDSLNKPAGDTRNIWQRHAPSWLGGKSAPDGATAPIPPATGAASDRQRQAVEYFMSRGWTKEQAAGITGRLFAESGLNPASHNDIGGGHTGIGQWDRNRWPRFLQMYGGDTSFQKQLEYVDWELNNTERAAGNKIRDEHTAYGSGIAMESFERAGNPGFTEQAARIGQGILGQLSVVRGAQAAGAGRTTNNDIDHNTQIDKIEVHTQATDAYGVGGAIGGAIKDTIRKNTLINSANTGLE